MCVYVCVCKCDSVYMYACVCVISVPLLVRCVCVGRNCALSPWPPGSYRSCEASRRSCCEPGGRGCAPGAESLHPDTGISTATTREKTNSKLILKLCIMSGLHEKSPKLKAI